MEKFDSTQKERLSFLANTVHEIRTPVQTIIGTLDLLSETVLDTEQQEYVRQIQFSSNVLLSLVNDILDFTKINAKRLNIESIPYDVISLAERTVDFVSIEAFNKGVELVIDTDENVPQFIMGDPTRVQQVLINLVKNAVKFTAKGYVHVQVLLKDFRTILFKVSDSGIGIPKEKLNNLFTDFYQTESSTSRLYGGTGLGLAISKGLIKSMNGLIGVEENPNGGTVFWFSLPLIPAKDFPNLKVEFIIKEKLRILIVDENHLVRKSLESKLNYYNITDITHAMSANDALQCIEYFAKKGKYFSIIFINMNLPVVDGWELAKRIIINKKSGSPKLYLLVPEGQMGEGAKMKCTNLFDGYIYKPIKRSRITFLLSELFPHKDIANQKSDSTQNENVSNVLLEKNSTLVGNSSLEKNSLLAENSRAKNNSLQTSSSKVKLEDTQLEELSFANDLIILIAEDHPLNRKILSIVLQRYGATVLEAKNGKEAVKIIKEHPEISIVFMDIQMPEMDGTTATKEVRKINYNGVIIACTANNDENDFEGYRKLGMNDILVKPFNKLAVKALLEKWYAVIELPESRNVTLLDNHSGEVWNKEYFDEIISGDIKIGFELLEEYKKQTKMVLEKLPLLASESNFDEIRRCAHLLNGSSSSIGAVKLSDKSKEISFFAKKKDVSGIKKVIEKIKTEFNAFEVLTDRWKSQNKISK